MSHAPVADQVKGPIEVSAQGGGPDQSVIAPQVEAMLIASGRVLSLSRIAQALGLEPPDHEEAPSAHPDPAQASDIQANAGAPKRRRPADADAAPSGSALVRQAIEALNGAYEQTGRAFRIEQVAGGWRVMTLPQFGAAIGALNKAAGQSKLSRSALEALAIVAYRQPVTRAHLEAIRGVTCGDVLKTLMDRRLVTIVGRAEELGRPILYGTTRQFLQVFGLASIKDLPSASELGLRT